MAIEFLVARIKAGLWTFSKLVFNANRDLPFHDFHLFELGNTAGWMNYVVGHNQVIGVGDQRKLFTSKSTLIHSSADALIRFNNVNNVTIVILANTWYEFKSNIYQVFVLDPGQTASLLKIYFEGVMYDEARRPE